MASILDDMEMAVLHGPTAGSLVPGASLSSQKLDYFQASERGGLGTSRGRQGDCVGVLEKPFDCFHAAFLDTEHGKTLLERALVL